MSVFCQDKNTQGGKGSFLGTFSSLGYSRLDQPFIRSANRLFDPFKFIFDDAVVNPDQEFDNLHA